MYNFLGFMWVWVVSVNRFNPAYYAWLSSVPAFTPSYLTFWVGSLVSCICFSYFLFAIFSTVVLSASFGIARIAQEVLVDLSTFSLCTTIGRGHKV